MRHLACLFVLWASALVAGGADRPSILWITVEDMSPTLGCYGDPYATTPHLDKLAGESVRYTRAFAASPVCSPSRCALITGVLPVTLGTFPMRSELPLPDGVRGFPAYLREAGWFCANNEKTDYNTAHAARLIGDSWDESSNRAHWRSGKRRAGQSFFAVLNDMRTHQSRTMTWPRAAFEDRVQPEVSGVDRHDPAKAPVPSYYPDTPLIRREVARYYDCVTAMDAQVGRILAELESDGLTDDTIVFFYSDHGSGMPRHKRLLHDTGMRVPLMIRFPEKYRHLAPAPRGSAVERVVTFEDFGPTVLSLLGVKAPSHLAGKPFLGPGSSEERQYVYGARDRVDEAFDTSRSLRDARYLYVRNFQPHLSYAQPSVYSDVGDIQAEIARVAREEHGTLSPQARHYVAERRPVEELYDCGVDPFNENNLLASALTDEQQAVLDRMRRDFLVERKRVGDLGCLPESELWRWAREEQAAPWDIASGLTSHRPDLEAIWAAADLVGRSSLEKALVLLDSPEPAVRYWGIVALRNFGEAPAEGMERGSRCLMDSASAVRLEAAGWLGGTEAHRERAVDTLIAGLDDPDWWVALHACRGLELLGPRALKARPAMLALHARTRNTPGDANLFLAFSTSAFLKSLGEPVEPWDFSPARPAAARK